MKNNFTRTTCTPQTLLDLIRKKLTGARTLSVLLFAAMLIVSLAVSITASSQQLTINSVTPLRGPAGSEVRIFASKFDTSDIYSNTVYFGAAKARVVGYSTYGSYLRVLVPNGATYAPITITQKRQTAATSQKFELSFPDAANLTEGSLAIPKIFHAAENMNCEKITLGDFDLDGKVDVATLGFTLHTSKTQGDVSIFKNVSTSDSIQLNYTHLYHINFQRTPVLTTADIDGDGKLDIVSSGAIVNGNRSFLVFRNKTVGGNIAFEPPKAFALPGQGKIKIGDVDGDGKPDVIYFYRDGVYLVKNTSQNAVISFGKTINLNVKGGTALDLADYNNDKKLDIVVYDERNSTAYFFQNASSGGYASFGFSMTLQFGSVRGSVPAIESGDYNGDGWNDVVLLFKEQHQTILVRNKKYPYPNMETVLGYVTKGKYQPSGALVLSDVNGDGKPEIVVGNRDLSLAVLQNAMANDRFKYNDPLYFDAPKNIADMAVADMNGDGKPDIVMGNDPRNFISVIKNQIGKSKTSPRITSFSPVAGILRDTIIINGNNFAGVRNVRFGGREALSYSILSDSVIAAVVDSGSSGAVSIVSNFGTTSKQGFTYLTAPVIKITADSLSVCSGLPVKITAEVFGRYPAYSYLWYKNGQRVGGMTQPYITTHLEQGDSVWAELTKFRQKTKSNILVFEVNPTIKPTITITANRKNTACKDSAVIFKALVRNGDASQIYQWMKNELPVGLNSPEYTDSNLSTGDSVYCVLRIERRCAFTPVNSNKIGFTIYNGKPSAPVAIIGPDAVHANEANITFSVNPSPGAANYQWQIPPDAGLLSEGTNDSILIDWGSNAGKISVKAVNVCGGSAVVTKKISLINDSEKVGARITNNIKIAGTAGVPDFIIFPNPATSSVTIIDKASTAKGFTARLTDGNGRVVRSSTSKVKVDWSVGDLAPGVYYIVITDGTKVIANKKLLVSH